MLLVDCSVKLLCVLAAKTVYVLCVAAYVVKMTCYNPYVAMRFKNGATFKSGKPLVKVVGAYSDLEDKVKLGEFTEYDAFLVPCGQCLGCRLKRSRDWAVRCVHEASLYKHNCFITLTFDDMHLPANRSISKRDLQLFMKRLRKRFKGLEPVMDDYGNISYPIRFFGCGEYGSLNERPHYHALLFNFDFEDKKPLFISKGGQILYVSRSLSELWPFGFCTIGEVSFDSAAYVAKYVFKKIGYSDECRGIEGRTPEFSLQSRRPGIAAKWLEKYSGDVYNYDTLRFKGLNLRPPSYYDRLFERINPVGFDRLLHKRKAKLSKLPSPSSGRLYYMEEVKKIEINKQIKKRNLTMKKEK